MNYFIVPGIKLMFRKECIPVLSPEQVIKGVCDHFEIRTDQIYMRSNMRCYVLPRQLAMYFIYHYGALSKSQIARHFIRDHTTVIFAIKQIGDLMESDLAIKNEVLELRQKIFIGHV